MDAVLVSDLLLFYLDGDMEMRRGIADCHDGLCVQTDGELIVFNLPQHYVFGPDHEEVAGAFENREDKIVGAFGANREE